MGIRVPLPPPSEISNQEFLQLLESKLQADGWTDSEFKFFADLSDQWRFIKPVIPLAGDNAIAIRCAYCGKKIFGNEIAECPSCGANT